MESCLFCKIINKEIPSSVVYEDDTVIAFLDINPVNIGHTLVVPKSHHEDLHALPDDLLAKVALEVKKIAAAVKAGVAADGINIEMNNGTAAGQIIPHAHIHIVPRYEGDGFTHWKGKRGYNEGEMTEVSEKIKSSIA